MWLVSLGVSSLFLLLASNAQLHIFEFVPLATLGRRFFPLEKAQLDTELLVPAFSGFPASAGSAQLFGSQSFGPKHLAAACV